jgi:hypothetical protein
VVLQCSVQGKVLLWLNGKKLQVESGKVQISMENLDYRLLLVGKPSA